MLRSLKVMMKRPLTLQDLEEAGEPYFKNPPMMPEWRDAIGKARGAGGRSLLDWWRESFHGDLEAIASGGTWARQKAKAIALILDLYSVATIHEAANNARHVEAWSHYVKNNPLFANVPQEKWQSLLFEWWLTSLMSYAAIETLGERLYAIDELKQLEMQLHQSLERESRRLDVRFLDEMLAAVDDGNDALARELTDFKTNDLDPYLRERNDLMFQMKEAITNDTLDFDRTKRRLEKLDARQKELKERFTKQA
jgi:hypothetical protein